MGDAGELKQQCSSVVVTQYTEYYSTKARNGASCLRRVAVEYVEERGRAGGRWRAEGEER